MSNALRLFAGSFIFLIVGCATYKAKPLQPEKTAGAFQVRRLDDPQLKAFIERTAGSTSAWNLDALTLVALYEHPDLDVARAQWKTTVASEETAGERPNPSISAGPTWVSNPDLGLGPWIAAVSVDIPIETAGKRPIRQKQAAAQAESARQSLIHTAWQIRGNVRASLIALIGAERAIAALRHQGNELDQNARLLDERARRGLVSPLNSSQADILAGKNRLALEDALRLETDSRAQLAQAIGMPLAALDGVMISSASWATPIEPSSTTVTEARRAALTGRSDLLGALADYAASEAALELEIAKQYPDIHLGPGYTFDQDQNKWGLGVTLPIPILNQNKGAIAEAKARREESAARFIVLQDKVINQVEAALANDQAAFRKWKAAQQIFAAQTKQNRATAGLLRPGDVSRLTLFRAQLDLDSTELSVGDAWRQTQEAQGALEDAIERPLTGLAQLPADAIEKNPREGGR